MGRPEIDTAFQEVNLELKSAGQQLAAIGPRLGASSQFVVNRELQAESSRLRAGSFSL